jgi:hypothetical protein
MPLMQPNSIKKSYSKYIISFNKNIIIAAIMRRTNGEKNQDENLEIEN